MPTDQKCIGAEWKPCVRIEFSRHIFFSTTNVSNTYNSGHWHCICATLTKNHGVMLFLSDCEIGRIYMDELFSFAAFTRDLFIHHHSSSFAIVMALYIFQCSWCTLFVARLQTKRLHHMHTQKSHKYALCNPRIHTLRYIQECNALY